MSPKTATPQRVQDVLAMAAKGQTSIEWLFIVAIVLTVVTITLVNYSDESAKTVAETTIRTQVDMALSRAPFTYPNCTNAKLLNITEQSPGNYTLYAYSPPNCHLNTTVLSEGVRQSIAARVAEALGCSYAYPAECKGKSYNLHVQRI